MIIDFNDNWIFYKEGLEESKVCVTTPHDAMIHEERTKDAQGGSASGFYPGGVYYYEKEYTRTQKYMSMVSLLVKASMDIVLYM